MAILIKSQNPKDDDYVDMKTMLVKGIRERLLDVTIHEEKATFKRYSEIIYLGYNISMIAEIMGYLSKRKTKIFLYNLPGYSIYDKLSDIINECMEYERIPFDHRDYLIDCWNYREILSIIQHDYKLRESANIE